MTDYVSLIIGVAAARRSAGSYSFAVRSDDGLELAGGFDFGAITVVLTFPDRYGVTSRNRGFLLLAPLRGLRRHDTPSMRGGFQKFYKVR